MKLCPEEGWVGGHGFCQGQARGKVSKKDHVSGGKRNLSWLECSARDIIPARLGEDVQDNLLNELMRCGWKGRWQVAWSLTGCAKVLSEAGMGSQPTELQDFSFVLGDLNFKGAVRLEGWVPLAWGSVWYVRITYKAKKPSRTVFCMGGSHMGCLLWNSGEVRPE